MAVIFQPIPLIFCLFLFLSNIIFYFPTWQWLYEKWMQSEAGYTHGPLIAAITLYLLWRERLSLNKMFQAHHSLDKYHWISILTLLASTFCWACLYLMGIESISTAFLPLILMATLGVIGGHHIGFKPYAAIALLYSTIPAWDLSIPILQSLAVSSTQILIRATGIPAFIEGIGVSIPYGQFAIEDGCSGLRYLLIAMTLAYIYCFMYLRDKKSMAILLLSSFLISILFNWARIFIIILIGYYTKMQSSLVEDHENFGWMIFAVALLPIFFMGHRLEKWEQHHPKNNPPPKIENTTESTTEKKSATNSIKISTSFTARTATALFISAIAPLLTYWVHAQIDAYPLAAAKSQISLWQLEQGSSRQQLYGWSPHFPSADSQQVDIYTQQINSDYLNRLYLFRIHYSTQKPGKEIIHYDNQIARDQQIITQETIKINGRSFHQISITASRGKKLLITYWYEIGGHHAAHSLEAKVSQIFAKLKGRTDATLYAITAPCGHHCDQAQRTTEKILISYDK